MDSKEYKMTKGEKIIWAAVYAHAMQPVLHPNREQSENKHEAIKQYRTFSEGLTEYERCKINAAIECAGSAITYLRKAKEHIKEGWEGSGLTYPCYLEMIEEYV